MKTVSGDLVAMAHADRFDVIAHGCNCCNRMGRGIAEEIRVLFPLAYEADRATEAGSRNKLGTVSSAVCPTGVDGVVTVVNCYTQYHWDKPKGQVLVNYDALRSCMRAIKQKWSGKRIGLPRIGAGLARGDWPTIEAIISEELAGEDVTIVVLLS